MTTERVRNLIPNWTKWDFRTLPEGKIIIKLRLKFQSLSRTKLLFVFRKHGMWIGNIEYFNCTVIVLFIELHEDSYRILSMCSTEKWNSCRFRTQKFKVIYAFECIPTVYKSTWFCLSACRPSRRSCPRWTAALASSAQLVRWEIQTGCISNWVKIEFKTHL